MACGLGQGVGLKIYVDLKPWDAILFAYNIYENILNVIFSIGKGKESPVLESADVSV